MASASLLALLSQQTPVKTRKALILTGLQNDFLSLEGKLPVNTASGFLDRLSDLVTRFREHGDIIWVRSQFVENRAVNEDDETGDAVIVGLDAPEHIQAARTTTPPPKHPSPSSAEDWDDDHPPSPPKKVRLSEDAIERSEPAHELAQSTAVQTAVEPDEELFLTRTTNREPCCIPGSFGAEYATQVKDLVDERRDLQLIKTYYSAFASTSLLVTLRAKLVTELYICGCTTNLSLFATAMDAARHGMKVTLVEDCLGYRRRDRHDKAIKDLHEIMGARLMTSGHVIERLKNPQAESDDEASETDESELAFLEAEEEEEEEEENSMEAIAADPLAVDSDEDDQVELLTTNVRLTRLSGRTVTFGNALSAEKRPSLPQAVVTEQDIRPSTQPREPSHPRTANTTCGDRDGRSTNSSASQRGNRGDTSEITLNNGLSGTNTTDGCSVGWTSDESSTEVTQMGQQGRGVIREHWWAFRKPLQRSPLSSHMGLSAMSAICGLDQKTVDDYEKMMTEARQRNDNAGNEEGKSVRSKPLFGEDKSIESAGSRLHYDLLPPEMAEAIFDELNGEISWQKMHHQTGEVPRLVCCQGTIDIDGGTPVYRHPSDQTLPIESWTPTVEKVRKAAEAIAGHELNHALIQLYRSGNDYISEHSDKTLDITKGTSIVNVSFGAQRTMRLRSKRAGASIPDGPSAGRITYRVAMPHNSMIVMTLPTNAEYLHGINADKRPGVELKEEETAYNGQRISLTFRSIATFLNKDSSRIWGQGATAQRKEEAKPVINADADESERLVRAFGKENSASSIEWEEIYGGGFDVLHLK